MQEHQLKRKQFTFYRSFYEAVQHLPEGRREPILMAILRYALDGEEAQNLEPVQAAIFTLVRPILDAGAQKAAGGRKGAATTNGMKSASPRHGSGKGENKIEGENKDKKENKNKIEKEDECLFAAFWAEYPRKTDKVKAFALWRQLRPEPSAVMAGLREWKASGQWLQEGGRFIPGPVRWLKEQMWTFAPKPPVPKGASGHLGEAELEALHRMLQED